MKKGIIKKLLKYIGVAILVTYFILNASITLVDYAYAKSYIFADLQSAETRLELASDLLEIEDAVKQNMASYEDSELPALGAAVATIRYARNYYVFEVLVLSIILGVIIGVLAYIIKNIECKKLVHYIVIYFLLLVVLSAICMIVTDSVNTTFRDMVVTSLYGISMEGFFDNILVIGLPYTVIYILVCVSLYMISKYKVRNLNDNM